MKLILDEPQVRSDDILHQDVQRSIIYVEMAKTAAQRIAYPTGEIFNWKSMYGKLDELDPEMMCDVIKKIGQSNTKKQGGDY